MNVMKKIMANAATKQIRIISWTSWLIKQIFFLFLILDDQKNQALVHGGFGRTSSSTMKLRKLTTITQKVSSLNPTTTLSMTSVTNKQVAIYDAAELRAIERFLSQNENSSMSRAISSVRNRYDDDRIGIMTVVTGKVLETGAASTRRVVGVQVSPLIKNEEIFWLDESTGLYPDSVAYIPERISDAVAITTYVSGLVTIHCTLPRVKQVGVSDFSFSADEDDFVGGKVVVIGGSDYAVFAARGLAALGSNVTVVSTKALSIKQSKNDELPIRVLPPAVGSLGFASVLGSFDSMLDTLSNEDEVLNDFSFLSNEYNSDKIDEGREISCSDSLRSGRGSNVVELLRTRHTCETYVSTLTHSQRLMRDEGALFGPSKAKEYESKVLSMVQSSNEKSDMMTHVVPPKGYAGNTLQKLFENGITYSVSGFHGKQDGVLRRGWSFQDFWELASWPRDSTGGVGMRFGFPIDDNIDIEHLYTRLDFGKRVKLNDSFLQGQQQEEQADSHSEKPEVNPFVVQVRGVEGLQSTILSSKKDFLLFLSAPFCRTCKLLSPQYTRMARSFSKTHPALVFAKADASGIIGKEIGKALRVDSVPAFVLFRKGQLYGSPIQITKLPSKKLDKAVNYLTSGNEWDFNVIRDET